MKNHHLKSVLLAIFATLMFLDRGMATQPVLLKPIGDRFLPTNQSLTINLTEIFRADASTNLVRVTTSLTNSNGIPLGFTMQLLPSNAPQTVANFLAYVNDGAYEGMMIHRSVSNFVVQTGGFTFSAQNPLPIATFPPVTNEFSVSNTRGTVAMAKTPNNPNSATSQWFVNLADNSLNLDNQNGGFSVFARVIGDGMTNVVDKIGSINPLNLTNYFYSQANTYTNLLDYYFVFDSVPVTNNSLVGISRIATIPYFALSSDSLSYAALISNSTLRINYTGGNNFPSNPVTISLFATDSNGLSTNTSFQVWHQTNQSRTIVYPTNSDVTFSSNGFYWDFYPYSSDGSPIPGSSISWVGPAAYQGFTNSRHHFSVTGTGTITFTYVQPGNIFYRSVTNSSSFVVRKAPQNITFPALTTNASNTVLFSSNPFSFSNTPTSSSGLQVSLTIAPGSPATWRVSNSQLLFSGVGTVTLVANQSGNSNYQAAPPVTNTLIVGKGLQTITFPPVSDQVLTLVKPTPIVPLRAVSTSGLPVQYRVVSGSGSVTNSSSLYVRGADTVAVEAYVPESSNYLAASPVTNTVTSKYLQTLRPFDKLPARTYATNLSFSVRVPVTDSTRPTSTNVILSASPTNIAYVTSNSIVNITGAGAVTLRATQSGDDVYFPASISTSFVVARAPQYLPPPEIIAIQNSSRLSNGIAPLSVKVPSASSGLPVTITASGAGYASTNGTNVLINLTNAGKITVTASQSGDGNYLPAKPTSITLSIAKGTQSINFPPIGANHRPGQIFPLEARAVPSGLPVSYRIIGGNGAARMYSTNEVQIAPNGSGTVTIVASQPGSAGYNPAVPITNSFTIQ